MLTKQKPTKNITSKSRTTELFNAPKIIKIGLRSSEKINFPRSEFFFIKKNSQRVQEMDSIFKASQTRQTILQGPTIQKQLIFDLLNLMTSSKGPGLNASFAGTIWMMLGRSHSKDTFCVRDIFCIHRTDGPYTECSYKEPNPMARFD